MGLASADFKINPAPRKQLWTPSDTAIVPEWVRGISFATPGAVNMQLIGDTQADIIPSGAIAPGIMFPCMPILIKATSTTATGFVLWGG
jgi:hypothetical protein